MSVLDNARDILSKMYKSKNPIAHNISSFCYYCAVSAYHFKKYSNEELEEVIKTFRPDITEEEKKLLRKNMKKLYFAERVNFDEYFLYDFENKNKAERKSFLIDSDRLRFSSVLNDRKKGKMLVDKYLAYEAYKEFYNRDVVLISDENDYDTFKSFVEKHPRFVKKIRNLSRGRGTEILDINKYSDDKELFKYILGEGVCVLEQLIVQNKEMASFHPHSVNTVRIPTVYKKDGTVEIICPFFRMGRNNSVVDNAGAGGILANVDAETGLILTNGFDVSGHLYEVHPDTGLKIKGFQVPNWEGAKKVASEIAAKVEGLSFVGWDFALDESGKWVIIEGNSFAQPISQIADKTGRFEDYERLIYLAK